MARERKIKSDPPESLTAADRDWLRSWAAEREPWALARLEDLEECCLDHFRATGKRMADWKLTVKNWIRNDRRFSRVPVEAARPRIQAFVPLEDSAVAELRRRREESRLRLVGRS